MSNIINQPITYVKDKELKIAFLGTPEFAVPILEKLIQSRYKPIAVFCAPDKPVGRKQILTSPPVKVIAQKNNIPIYQPENVADFKLQITSLNPDLIICAAYSLILPKEVLDVPKFGCLNIHPSLLPKYRGPSPIQYAILNGDKETGVTIIKMNEKIDAGPIVVNYKLQITNYKFTTPQLSQKLSEIGADLLLKILPNWLSGKIRPQPQDESQATYTKIIKKEDGLINWQRSAQEIERQIRAFTPWPGAYTRIMNNESRIMNLKITEAAVSKDGKNKKLGEVFLTDNGELVIRTNDGCLLPGKLQMEGGKPMSADEFLRGHHEIVGQIFL